MPFPIPTLSALRLRARGFFAARLPGLDVTQPRSRIVVSADNMAGITIDEFGYLSWMQQQLFLDTCESSYLDRAGAKYNLPRKQPTFAIGNMIFTGTSPNSIAIAADTVLTASDGATQFETTTAAAVATGTATVPVTAITAGSAGNLAPSAPVTLFVGIPGILPTAYVDGSGLAGGTDIETDDAYRARLYARIQQPPQGGCATDWWQWILAYPGATRAWVYPRNRGLGTVDVMFVIDTRPTIIPVSGDLTAAAAYLASRATVLGDGPGPQVTADYQVLAPTASPLNMVISNLVTLPGTLTATAQANIAAAYADLISRVSTPGGATVGSGITGTLGSNPPGTVYLEQIVTAIATAAGVVSFDLTSPTTDTVVAQPYLIEPGTITYS
jgi:uncharacterized phage protein gp47/JayE